MLIRIVKMTFKDNKVADFQAIFESSKLKIRKQPGCQHLELLRDINSPNIFMTYSYWDNVSDLNNYRKSELFGKVWKATKILFEKRAEAWSVKQEWTGK